MRRLRTILLGILALLAAGAVWAAWRINSHPSLAAYDGLALPAATAGGLRVTFLGVSTLLIDDGETAILTDGFFSRPGKLQTLFGRVAPDETVIERTLAKAGIGKLAAVIAVHSHYDHAMDSPDVARRTGARLIGSDSTANIARGRALPAEQMQVVRDGETLSFGRFRVTMVLSRHFPHPLATGAITEPLVPPAHSLSYREGGSYSVFIEHDGRTLLVQGSAGFVPGGLSGRRAEVIFLGVGGMGSRTAEYHEAYWREVVQTVGARRVIPIHWDDFTRPLDQPLVAMPMLLDDVPASFDFLADSAKRQGVELRLAPVWQAIDPFAGL
jgi:L-ascorbate metabolism protein UlaG (beta-lactamase superfamily)